MLGTRGEGAIPEGITPEMIGRGELYVPSDP